MKIYLFILVAFSIGLFACEGSGDLNLSGVTASDTENVTKTNNVAKVKTNSPGDINKDGVVDAEDYGYFKQMYDRYPDGCAYSDANCDGIVDGKDLEIWQQSYGEKRYKIGDLDSDGKVTEADFDRYIKNPDLLK